jgi:hypothetical protein
VVLVRTDVLKEHIASITGAKRFRKLGMLAVHVFQFLIPANVEPSLLILFNLTMEAIRSSETSDLSRATWCHIPEDGIPQRTYNCKLSVSICITYN